MHDIKHNENAKKWRKAVQDNAATTVKARNERIEYVATIKVQDDKINAQASYIGDIEKQLKEREEQDSIILCEDNKGYVTELVYTKAYNVCIPFMELNGMDLPVIVKTALYQRFPFIKRNGNTIVIDETQYKKYKGAILL